METRGSDSEVESIRKSFQEYSKNEVIKIIDTIAEHEIVHNKQNALYKSAFMHSEADALTEFREELLRHLAYSIYVKEHRQKYQQEQFNRYVSSISTSTLFTQEQTLKNFCLTYALFLEYQIDESHNFKSPKIEANYLDYDTRTSRPIDSTVFHYFFSFQKAKRQWAKWMIASAKYPNENLRAAYLRFFTA